jgi:hypothetical protein
MAKSYSVADLISRVKRFASIPTNQLLFSNQDFIEMLDDEMTETIIPIITQCREDYFIRTIDVAIERDKYEYEIPHRAFGGKLDNLQLIDPNNSDNLSEFTHMARISPNRADLNLNGFYYKSNKIVIVNPNAKTTMKLRFHYECRPGHLVDSLLAGNITNIDTGLNEVTLDAVPSSWVSGTTVFDLIGFKPPFSLKEIDQSATIASTILTFTDLPNDLEIGDIVCEATCSPLAQIPEVFQNLLCQATAIKCLEAQNADSTQAQVKYEKMKDLAISQVTPRVNKAPKYVTNRNAVIHDVSVNRYI